MSVQNTRISRRTLALSIPLAGLATALVGCNANNPKPGASSSSSSSAAAGATASAAKGGTLHILTGASSVNWDPAISQSLAITSLGLVQRRLTSWKIGSDGKIVKPDVAKLVGYYVGLTPDPAGINLLELTIKAGSIPRCAMEVWRDVDLGTPISNAPAEPCGCYFEATATGSSTCQACPGGKDSECGATAPHCRFGYCEVN